MACARCSDQCLALLSVGAQFSSPCRGPRRVRGAALTVSSWKSPPQRRVGACSRLCLGHCPPCPPVPVRAGRGPSKALSSGRFAAFLPACLDALAEVRLCVCYRRAGTHFCSHVYCLSGHLNSCDSHNSLPLKNMDNGTGDLHGEIPSRTPVLPARPLFLLAFSSQEEARNDSCSCSLSPTFNNGLTQEARSSFPTRLLCPLKLRGGCKRSVEGDHPTTKGFSSRLRAAPFRPQAAPTPIKVSPTISSICFLLSRQ